MTDQTKSLTELEKDDWGKGLSDGSPLVQTCFELRHKPIKDFSIEDLRVMIGQDIGLPYLIPKALSILEQDPLAEGMHYKGDLLCNVLEASPYFYNSHPELINRVDSILDLAQDAMKSLDEIDLDCLKEALEQALGSFKLRDGNKIKTKLDIERTQKELESAIQELKKLKDPDRPA